MNLAKAEQAIINGIYAATAWLMLDFGLLIKERGAESLSVLVSRPAMAIGAVIVVACIAGLVYKSRVAAIVLFLIFLVPLLLRTVQQGVPSSMSLLFSLILLYFFLAALLGTFSYHQHKTSQQDIPD
jgi:hypothetical protein